MNRVIVLSGYDHEILKPFGESMRVLFTKVFGDLKISFRHIYGISERLETRDTTIIFFMTPELYIKIRGLVNKNNNKFVLWNVEPCDTNGLSERKYIVRRDLLREILDTDINLDHMWVYHDLQEKYFNNPKCSYLPIGFHECMMSKIILSGKEETKTKQRNVVFLGHSTGFRKYLLRDIRRRLRINRFADILTTIITYRAFGDNDATKLYLGSFRLGVDMHSGINCLDAPHWHRIMVYAGAGVAIMTQSDLSKYGFIEGVHYIGFSKAGDLAIKINNAFEDLLGLTKMTRNMRKKVQGEYHMTKLLKEAIEKLL